MAGRCTRNDNQLIFCSQDCFDDWIARTLNGAVVFVTEAMGNILACGASKSGVIGAG